MNWLDIVVLVLIVSSAVSGLARGLVRELAGLFGLILGLYVAMRYHQSVALAVDAHRGGAPWAKTIAFILLTLLIWTAGEFAGFLVAKSLDMTGTRWLDRIVGAVFGVIRGFVVAGIMLLLVGRYFGESRVPVASSTLGRPAVATAQVIADRLWREIRQVEHVSSSAVAAGGMTAGGMPR